MAKVAYTYKGCIEHYSDLPLVGNVFGDYYYIKETGLQYYWSIVAPVGAITNWLILNKDTLASGGLTGPTGSPSTGPTGPAITGPTGPASLITGPTGVTGPIPYGQIFWADDTPSIGGYKTFSRTPPTAGTVSVSQTVKESDGEVELASFITPTMEMLFLPLGPRTFTVWLSVDDPNDISTCKIRVFKRTTGGVETPVFDTVTPAIVELVATALYATVIIPEISISYTDRMLCRFYAQTTSHANKTITLYYQDGTQTNIQTPVALYGSQGPTGVTHYHQMGI